MASRLLTRSAISPRPRTTVRFSSGAKAAMMHLPTVRRRNPKSVVSDVQADDVILNGQPYNLIRYWNRRCTVQTPGEQREIDRSTGRPPQTFCDGLKLGRSRRAGCLVRIRRIPDGA